MFDGFKMTPPIDIITRNDTTPTKIASVFIIMPRVVLGLAWMSFVSSLFLPALPEGFFAFMSPPSETMVVGYEVILRGQFVGWICPQGWFYNLANLCFAATALVINVPLNCLAGRFFASGLSAAMFGAWAAPLVPGVSRIGPGWLLWSAAYTFASVAFLLPELQRRLESLD